MVIVGEPLRFTKASTEIPQKTTAAPSHCPPVSLWLYMTTERSIVNNLRVNVIVLVIKGEMTRFLKGESETHTRVRDPKCWRVSKMNNWPRAPVIVN